MQCKTFCSAASYKLIDLHKFFKKNYESPKKFDNVIYTPFKEGHVFFFAYGCVVFWNLDDEEIEAIFKILKNYEIDHLPNIYRNSDSYFIVFEKDIKVYQNEIHLPKDSGVMEMLAVSYALAQSMKLSEFEERVEYNIKKTEHIPKSLASTGKITLSGKEIAKMMGKLFIERSSINLHSDILDTPDFFWDYPELEPIYHMTAKDQDIKQRVDILNKRLNLIHELFEILSDVFNNRHSSLLEIIIIALISVEIMLTIGLKIMQ